MARPVVAALLILLVGIVLYVSWPGRQAPAIGPGIPQALADDRAARITGLTYEVSFDIPAARTEPIHGTVTATFTLSDVKAPLAFDFTQPPEKFLGARVNGDVTEVVARDGHLIFPAGQLLPGRENEITIDFIAGDEALNRQDEFLYTLFVPARASIAMPVFDQPNLKARWVLALKIPPAWNAVANGAETGRIRANDRTELIFARTEPLPTYLFGFAAGQFTVETGERNGRRFRMFHRETDAAKVAKNRDAIFDLHATAIRWLEDYTTLPYAFGKFDFVAIPSFQFGGMEHAGAVFYNASSLFLDDTATQNQRLGRASLIAHETAHMWFGDLVTMRWFNDVWMKEVFANFMAAKIVNPSFPGVNHDLRFLYSHYPAAYDVDRTPGANPIRQPLSNLNEAGSLYGAIIYQKAPIVMRQLELLLGADQFRDGLRDYLRRYAMANATWPDLIQILDARTPADLAAWSRAWVEERGRPRVRVDVTPAAAGGVDVTLQGDDPMGRPLTWPQALHVVLGSGARAVGVDVTLGDNGRASFSHTSSDLPAGVLWVLPTGGGLGYGDFVLPDGMVDALATDLPAIADPLTRGAAMVTLWESMLEGRMAPARLRGALMAALPLEKDELNITRQMGLLQSLFWRFSSADDRAAASVPLEALLTSGLARATTTSLKSTWFNAIRNTATTPGTIAWLRRVWDRGEKVPGLTLSENDETDLAMELALRGVDDAEGLLDAQAARILNPDRKARFAFVRPSVSGSAATREALFNQFKDVANRRREAWVLEAMGYLHHPLRADQSRHLVVPALQMVREIRDTGDIFFPKRWADATLGGHRSQDTAADVRAYLDSLPADYPERLRWVLLASADPLFRAAR
ncbi:MAG: M1 family aminopeptidase [Acidobacteria bacterium]|nr:M1 family aminopeptidase [Acidobacteriota bacterium]